MGQAKARKLNLVAQTAAGEPVTITLGEKSARRLAALYFATQGAKLTADAATAQHNALHAKWLEAIGGVLEAHGVEAAGGVDHDTDAGTLTVAPAADP